ncbi:UvrD-helicase domain-containing protein [Amycolatopsis minnesotensis]|uniref:DNA 3'-5' helicase n=1 Tax=Amycolatopsis minnesotensis TaxID=337894 RepID=A0ABN2SQN6_9PSEU
MAQLAIDKDFLREFARLERQVQDRVTEVFARFENAHHAGIHLERINNAHDTRFRSIRITHSLRGIVLAPESGDTYVLLKVLPHDKAYDWAKGRTASVNATTGRIEIRDTVAIDASLPELSRMAETAPTRLFAAVDDGDLIQLGIDQQTLGFARALTDPVQLEAAKSFLPSTQWDVLYGLAAGLSPDEVWMELSEAIVAEPVDTDDLVAAVKRSPDRIVLVDGPDELMAIFAHPFALWRIYLHPAQRSVVRKRYRGPARVSGGPGTGKTVVALHRAHFLAEQGEGRILVTTFTSALTDSLKAGIKLLTPFPEVANRIEVLNVDQLAHRIFRDAHGSPSILQRAEEKIIWQHILENLGLDFSESFLADEWRQVVLAQRVSSAREYLAAKRDGRGRQLGPRQKAQVWQALLEFTETLRTEGHWTHETVRAEATRLLENRNDKPYRHIVVDEAQDLSAEGWRLLREATPGDRDDIFIAGDTHQRIYNNRVTLKDVGINIRGRSSKLRINYRTTAEILAWSLGLMRGERIDDMEDGLDSIAGCRSDVHGLPPEPQGFATLDAELDHLRAKIRTWLGSGVQPGEIGVAARAKWLLTMAQQSLSSASIPTGMLAEGRAADEAVSLGTMHLMKGLEYRCLAVIGVGDRQIPARNAVTPIEEDETTHRQDLQRELCLLFVACTRAREQLSVTWHGARSRFLANMD